MDITQLIKGGQRLSTNQKQLYHKCPNPSCNNIMTTDDWKNQINPINTFELPYKNYQSYDDFILTCPKCEQSYYRWRFWLPKHMEER